MTCEHTLAAAIVVDPVGAIVVIRARTRALVMGAAWCPDCGALKDAEGVWNLPESARVQVVVAPPSPHRIQSTGGDSPAWPEFRPFDH